MDFEGLRPCFTGAAVSDEAVGTDGSGVSSGVRRLRMGTSCVPVPPPQSGQFLQLSAAETSVLILWLLCVWSAAQTSMSHNCLSFLCVRTINIHV